MSVETPERTNEKPKKPRIGRSPDQNRIVYYLARVFLTLFYKAVGRMEVFGRENVPPEGPVILAPNHSSDLDPPLIGCCLKRTVWFMAKEELFRAPVIGPLFPFLQAFPVRRGSADRAALKAALNYLARNEIVLIFPEGHRSADGNLLPAELGVGMVALRSQAPVIPVGIQGSWEMFPPGAKLPRFGRLRVRFGEPVDLSDLYDRKENRETLQECANRIMEDLARILGQPAPSIKPRAQPGGGE
jgi:1-acyl-sn-glycerol-3-phosphate acyltransferase